MFGDCTLLYILLIVVVLLCQSASLSTKRKYPQYPQMSNMTLRIDTIFKDLLKGYEKEVRPHWIHAKGEEKPYRKPGYEHTLFVEVNMLINSIGSVNVVDMDYTMDLLLRQRWIDYRLTFEGFEQFTSPLLRESIWIPDLFFRNAKSARVHEVTTPNYLVWVTNEGIVTYSQKVSLTLSCNMNLWRFPLDTQTCNINIGSYGYPEDQLEFRWWHSYGYDKDGLIPEGSSECEPITVPRTLKISEFDLVAYSTVNCSVSYEITGTFTCLEAHFKLKRDFKVYLLYTYIPTFFNVFIQWLSFFIDYEAVPARVSLGLTCMLALVTQSSSLLMQLPRVSYIKAIDIWLFTCIAFNVVALLEFAVVNSMAVHNKNLLRDRKKQREEAQQRNNLVPHIATTPEVLRKLLLANKLPPNSNDINTPPTEVYSEGYLPMQIRQRLCPLGDGDDISVNTLLLSYKKRSRTLQGCGGRPNTSFVTLNGKKSKKEDDLQRSIIYLERWAIFLFPFFFGIFNIGYWGYFVFMGNPS